MSIVYSNMQKYGWEAVIEFVPKYCKKLNKSLGYVFLSFRNKFEKQIIYNFVTD